jgi:uncharacterized protein Yka (UPF0111/DUF47 family)
MDLKQEDLTRTIEFLEKKRDQLLDQMRVHFDHEIAKFAGREDVVKLLSRAKDPIELAASAAAIVALDFPSVFMPSDPDQRVSVSLDMYGQRSASADIRALKQNQRYRAIVMIFERP